MASLEDSGYEMDGRRKLLGARVFRVSAVMLLVRWRVVRTAQFNADAVHCQSKNSLMGILDLGAPPFFGVLACIGKVYIHSR